MSAGNFTKVFQNMPEFYFEKLNRHFVNLLTKNPKVLDLQRQEAIQNCYIVSFTLLPFYSIRQISKIKFRNSGLKNDIHSARSKK